MAVGQSLWADISAITNDIYEGALFTLREQNVLARTVTVFTDNTGFAPRKNSRYGAANFRAVGDGEDVTPTVFDRDLLSTLTPARYADQFFLSDIRVASDQQNVRLDGALELGAAAATLVDEYIADDFSSLTGGTIGTAGGTITWAKLIAARSLMQGLKIPGPYWCALHPYQWNHLVQAAVATGTEVANAPGFQDALVSTFFVSNLLGGVIFAISGAVNISGSDATGAMYSSLALAYDERLAFNVRPERDESREGTELNASLWFAHGVWDPTRGIQLIGDAATPE